MLPVGSGGRPLCRQCGNEVGKGRRSFCSGECVHQWRLRTDPGYLREQVFARDRGVCAGCGADTVALEGELKRLRRRNPIAWKQRMEELYIPTARKKNLWDADHIVPVAEGGGECGLDNLRTLCLRCHRLVTEELRKRLQRRKQEVTEA